MCQNMNCVVELQNVNEFLLVMKIKDASLHFLMIFSIGLLSSQNSSYSLLEIDEINSIGFTFLL